MKPVRSGAFKGTLRHGEIYVEHQPLLKTILYTNIFKYIYKRAILFACVLFRESYLPEKEHWTQD